MLNNPFAKIFYDDFNSRVIKTCNLKTNNPTQTHPSVNKTIHRINTYLAKCSDPKQPLQIDISNHNIPTRDFNDYCASLRATMIIGSKNIEDINSQMSLDENILNIFDITNQYFTTRSDKVSDIYDYITHKLDHNNNLEQSTMHLNNETISHKENNVFIFGVSRDKEDNPNLAAAHIKHTMQDMIDEPYFKDRNIFTVNFPTSYPEEIAVPSILNTIKYPDDFGEAEALFVQNNWQNFIAKEIEFNEDGDITNHIKYSPQELQDNMKNLSILGYCAGSANAHRCINALKEISSQIYTKEELDPALKNISVINYAFLPPKEKLDYTNISVFCNDKSTNNPEAIVRCNFPELYGQAKLNQKEINSSKITKFGDSNIISLEMPKDIKIRNKTANLVSREINNRNGHRLQNVTNLSTNSTASKVYSYILKQSLNRNPVEDKIIRYLGNNIQHNNNGNSL